MMKLSNKRQFGLALLFMLLLVFAVACGTPEAPTVEEEPVAAEPEAEEEMAEEEMAEE